MKAIDEIAYERCRQKSKERFSQKHDDDHYRGELARAASCYAVASFLTPSQTGIIHPPSVRSNGSLWWPWDWKWWKPRSHRENLIRAAALIVAEIERLDRADRRARAGRKGA